MADENNEFRGFIRAEIKNVRDAAERNYEEHQVIFAALTDVREKLAGLEERLEAVSQSHAAKYAMWGAWGAAVLMAGVALLKTLS